MDDVEQDFQITCLQVCAGHRGMGRRGWGGCWGVLGGWFLLFPGIYSDGFDGVGARNSDS